MCYKNKANRHNLCIYSDFNIVINKDSNSIVIKLVVRRYFEDLNNSDSQRFTELTKLVIIANNSYLLLVKH